jgi:hypothetical protein
MFLGYPNFNRVGVPSSEQRLEISSVSSSIQTVQKQSLIVVWHADILSGQIQSEQLLILVVEAHLFL